MLPTATARAARVALVVVMLLPDAAAFASLGGPVSSVEADRVQTKSALVRIARSAAYTVHEIQSPTGTSIREYYGANGIVFGVSWDGEFPPDLQQLLGTYFEPYQTAVRATRRTRKARGSLAVDGRGLVVRTTAHTRSFTGIAYDPALIPAGVPASVVR